MDCIALYQALNNISKNTLRSTLYKYIRPLQGTVETGR